MALWVCGGEAGCGTKYAVGLFRCPRCHNVEFFEDGDPMAKITRHGGASDKTLPTPEAAPTDAAPAAEVRLEYRGEHGPETIGLPVDAPVYETRSESEGGEGSSPGSSSETSTEKPPTNSAPSSKPRRKPARKTANRSTPAPTESSTAPSTDGDQEDATSATDSAPEGGESE
jgi:hypothetical protein